MAIKEAQSRKTEFYSLVMKLTYNEKRFYKAYTITSAGFYPAEKLWTVFSLSNHVQVPLSTFFLKTVTHDS